MVRVLEHVDDPPAALHRPAAVAGGRRCARFILLLRLDLAARVQKARRLAGKLRHRHDLPARRAGCVRLTPAMCWGNIRAASYFAKGDGGADDFTALAMVERELRRLRELYAKDGVRLQPSLSARRPAGG